MTASRVSAWCFSDLEKYIQIKCMFLMSVWKSQTAGKDDSIPWVLVAYKVTPQCYARKLPEFDRSVGFSAWTTSSWRWGGRSTGRIYICFFFKKCYVLGLYICKAERRFSFLYLFDPSLGFNLSHLISKRLCGPLRHAVLSSRRFSVPPSKPSRKPLSWLAATW